MAIRNLSIDNSRISPCKPFVLGDFLPIFEEKMRKLHPFLQAHMIFLIIAIPLFFFPKGTFLLWLNDLHTPPYGQFFRYITFLGDGILPAIFILLLLFVSYYKTILFTAAILLETAIVQGLGKQWLFSHLVRPKKFFGEHIILNFVEGVNVHGHHTFPSGHTGVAFVWLCFLALSVNKKWGLPLFLVAFIAALSRVYILQHFFVDIYFGSLIGTVAVVLVKYLFDTKTSLAEKPGWQKGLLGNRL